MSKKRNWSKEEKLALLGDEAVEQYVEALREANDPEPSTQSGRTVNEEAKVDTIDIFRLENAQTGEGEFFGPLTRRYDTTVYDTSILNKGERRSVQY